MSLYSRLYFDYRKKWLHLCHWILGFQTRFCGPESKFFNIRLYGSGPREDIFLITGTTYWTASEKSLKTTALNHTFWRSNGIRFCIISKFQEGSKLIRFDRKFFLKKIDEQKNFCNVSPLEIFLDFSQNILWSPLWVFFFR
jgi:hypothetical protein